MVGDDVAHLEDLAHAAVSQQGDDFVVSYGFADLKVVCGHPKTSNFGSIIRLNLGFSSPASQGFQDAARGAAV
jgi:hypothetical protein